MLLEFFIYKHPVYLNVHIQAFEINTMFNLIH